MKTTKRLLIGSTLLAASILATSANAGIDRATILANTCAGCHGPNGVSNGPSTPTIAGLTEFKIIQSMNDFKSGRTSSTIMQRIAKGYSDQDIKDLAGYFSKQKTTPVISAK
ncbi:MAG: hypothetical protein ISEC1_P1603 [Thiomicrorhabdus sp.]|nr:MAG: hypothetical protein ISEC1_P1603 [Thiomicrorhabdus sp.]